MKGDKAAAAAKSSPEWRSCRETNEGRQGGSGITTIWRLSGSATRSLRSKNPYSCQEQARMELTRAGQNGDHAGRQMKGHKAAGAAKSSPEWRSCRETRRHMKGNKAAVASQPFGDCGDQQPDL